MEYFLTIQTEVNDQPVTAYAKTWLEYPEEENLRCMVFEVESTVKKLTGLSRVENGSHYLWSYEEYNEEKHAQFGVVDLTDTYTPVFTQSS